MTQDGDRVIYHVRLKQLTKQRQQLYLFLVATVCYLNTFSAFLYVID